MRPSLRPTLSTMQG